MDVVHLVYCVPVSELDRVSYSEEYPTPEENTNTYIGE
jgi:hypothetical protein